MNEVIGKLEKESGLPFYFLERPSEEVNCVVYNYVKDYILADGRKENDLVNFYFILITDKEINKKINIIEDTLFNNLFTKISVNRTEKLKSGSWQTSITATKII